MDISYKILWYEDNQDWYKGMNKRVEKIIKEFNLIPQIDYKKTPEINIEEIQSQNYDLILVDYKLTNIKNVKTGVNGDKVIENIRNGEIYTDVIFYSEDGKGLKDAFKKKELEGVFITTRDTQQFVNKVKDIAYKNLRRSISPVNLRGIVMDNTSEFDTEMKEIILKSWECLDEKQQSKLNKYIKEDLLEKSIESSNKKYEKYIKDSNIIIYKVIEDMIFDSSKKARLLNKIMSLNEDYCKELREIFNKLSDSKDNFYKNYDDEIIKYRNALAHAKRTENENDIYIGKCNGKNIIFNTELCDEIRKNLIKYRNIFKELYKYIEER